MRHKTTIIGIFLFCLTCVTACNPPVKLDAKFSESVHLKSKITPCPLQVTQVQDLRKSPETLGEIAGRRILHSDITGWVKSGISKYEILVDEKPPIDNAIAIDMAVLQAHGRSISTSMSVTVAIQVKFSRHGVVLLDKLYRGNQTQMNIINGDGEIHSCFDQALKKALQQIYDDACQLCGDSKAP